MEVKISSIVIDLEDKILKFKEFNKAMSDIVHSAPKTIEEAQEKVLAEQVDKLLYSREASFLFSEIIFGISMLKSFSTIESEIINKFWEETKDSFYKRRFHIENGKIKENENGFLEKQRRIILDSEQFKKTVEYLEKTSPQ